jgi:hypothetical protein
MTTSTTNLFLTAGRRVAARLGWTRSSYALMGAFVLTCGLIVYIWWPLAEEYLALVDWRGPWWLAVDWLLIGVFLVMSLLIMAGADLKGDLPIVLIGLAGGLAIESWGTQTTLWTYYTLERPPLWIIPAWPIASLSIDRLVRAFQRAVPERVGESLFGPLYWLILPGFAALMLVFVWPTLGKSQTIMALILCGLLIASPKDARLATLTFAAGAGLGYFLELWGTTRLCWTYYTGQQPPLFAVLAHGMAALAFWRVKLLFETLYRAFLSPRLTRRVRRGYQPGG